MFKSRYLIAFSCLWSSLVALAQKENKIVDPHAWTLHQDKKSLYAAAFRPLGKKTYAIYTNFVPSFRSFPCQDLAVRKSAAGFEDVLLRCGGHDYSSSHGNFTEAEENLNTYFKDDTSTLDKKLIQLQFIKEKNSPEGSQLYTRKLKGQKDDSVAPDLLLVVKDEVIHGILTRAKSKRRDSNKIEFLDGQFIGTFKRRALMTDWEDLIFETREWMLSISLNHTALTSIVGFSRNHVGAKLSIPIPNMSPTTIESDSIKNDDLQYLGLAQYYIQSQYNLVIWGEKGNYDFSGSWSTQDPRFVMVAFRDQFLMLEQGGGFSYSESAYDTDHKFIGSTAAEGYATALLGSSQPRLGWSALQSLMLIQYGLNVKTYIDAFDSPANGVREKEFADLMDLEPMMRTLHIKDRDTIAWLKLRYQ